MEKIFSGKYLHNSEELGGLYYILLSNGFEVYIGSNAAIPSYRQTEPYIPNPDLSYEDNAKIFCNNLSVPIDRIDRNQADKMYASVEDITSLRSDIDYLMLLNDSDSLSDGE